MFSFEIKCQKLKLLVSVKDYPQGLISFLKQTNKQNGNQLLPPANKAFRAEWVIPPQQQPGPHASAEKAFDFWRVFGSISQLLILHTPDRAFLSSPALPCLAPVLALPACRVFQHHPDPGPQEPFTPDLEWLGDRGSWLEGRLEKHSEILFGLAQRRTHTNHTQPNFNLTPGTSRLAGQSKAELKSRRRKENEPDGILTCSPPWLHLELPKSP